MLHTSPDQHYMWLRGPPKAIKASKGKVTLPWKHDYPTSGTQLPYWGTPVTLPSLAKSSTDLGESYPTRVGLLDVYRAASYSTKRATDEAGVVQTSCDFQGIFLTPHCGPSIGTAR